MRLVRAYVAVGEIIVQVDAPARYPDALDDAVRRADWLLGQAMSRVGRVWPNGEPLREELEELDEHPG